MSSEISSEYEYTDKMRATVVEWMYDVVVAEENTRYVFQSAVIIYDEYLSKDSVKRSDLQAIASVALHLASAMERPDIISLEDLCYWSNDTYTEKFLSNIKKIVLEKLNYYVGHETILQHIIGSNYSFTNDESFFLANYLSHLFFWQKEYQLFEPRVLANKIIEFSMIIQKKQQSLQRLINNDPVYNYLYLIWCNDKNYPRTSIEKDFAKKKYFAISTKEIPKIIPRYTDSHFIQNLVQPIVTIKHSIKIYTDDEFKNFKILETLGQGAYGKVFRYLIKSPNNNQNVVAIKMPNKMDDLPQDMLNEINCLRKINHSNIIKLHGLYYHPDKNKFLMIMECMDIDLERLANNYGSKPFAEDLKISFIIQLLKAVSYIHNLGIYHWDISTKNILISKDGILKLADFGFSRWARYPGQKLHSDDICVVIYRPIEVLLRYGKYNDKVDVWSCACVIGFMLNNNKYLMKEYYNNDMVEIIYNYLGTPRPGFNEDVCLWPGFSKPKKIFEGTKFYTLDDKYPDEVKILYRMFEYHPDRRISSEQALNMFKELHKKLAQKIDSKN